MDVAGGLSYESLGEGIPQWGLETPVVVELQLVQNLPERGDYLVAGAVAKGYFVD